MKQEPRNRALADLWPWLPAFRAVAETPHLPTASKALGVTASTLSRAIAALERAVGCPLFRRTGRSLQLAPAGALLLDAVRDAMRWVEDGVTEAKGQGHAGAFVIASSGAATTAVVAPALLAFGQRHPRLVPHVVTCEAARVPGELLKGALDVAFQEHAATADGITTAVVAELPRSLYCGPRHPLFTRRKVTLDDLAHHSFVAPPTAAGGATNDGWPPEQPRRIGMVVDQIRVGVEVCAALPLLAVLPDALAGSRGGELRRLAIDGIQPSRVYALHRRPLGRRRSLAGELVHQIQSAAATGRRSPS